MSVHRKDLFCRTLYCRSQSPQVAVLLFFFFGPSSVSLHREGGDFGGKFAFKLPKQSYYIPIIYLSNRIIYILIPRQLMPAYKP